MRIGTECGLIAHQRANPAVRAARVGRPLAGRGRHRASPRPGTARTPRRTEPLARQAAQSPGHAADSPGHGAHSPGPPPISHPVHVTQRFVAGLPADDRSVDGDAAGEPRRAWLRVSAPRLIFERRTRCESGDSSRTTRHRASAGRPRHEPGRRRHPRPGARTRSRDRARQTSAGGGREPTDASGAADQRLDVLDRAGGPLPGGSIRDLDPAGRERPRRHGEDPRHPE
jgi:hypothetical protein